MTMFDVGIVVMCHLGEGAGAPVRRGDAAEAAAPGKHGCEPPSPCPGTAVGHSPRTSEPVGRTCPGTQKTPREMALNGNPGADYRH